MRFEVTTQASPEQVRDALTDFTDRRTRIWNHTLDPRTYQVREVGETWAVARESTGGSPFWVVIRYDWSDPTVIRTSVVEASWGGEGEGAIRISPTEGGGSRVHAEWTHTGATRLRDRLMLVVLETPPMRRLVAHLWVAALDRHARSALAGEDQSPLDRHGRRRSAAT